MRLTKTRTATIIGMVGIVAASVLIFDVQSSAEPGNGRLTKKYSCTRHGFTGTIAITFFEHPTRPGSQGKNLDEVAFVQYMIDPPWKIPGADWARVVFSDRGAIIDRTHNVLGVKQDEKFHPLTGAYLRHWGQGPVGFRFQFDLGFGNKSLACAVTISNVYANPDSWSLGIQSYACEAAGFTGIIYVWYKRSAHPDHHGAALITGIEYKIETEKKVIGEQRRRAHVRVQDDAQNLPVLETTKAKQDGKTYHLTTKDEEDRTYVRSRPGTVQMKFEFTGVRAWPDGDEISDPDCEMTLPDFV